MIADSRHGQSRRAGRLAACSSALLLGLVAGAAAQIVDRVLATVDRQIITLSDVRAAIALQLVDSSDPDVVLSRLVDRTLVLGEVARYAPPEPPPEAIDEAVARVEARLGREQLSRVLQRSGLDERGLRLLLRQNLLIDAYLAQRFAVVNPPGDEEVARRVADRPEEFLAASGDPLPADAALALARARLADERRQRLIREWIDELRGRAVISFSAAAGDRR